MKTYLLNRLGDRFFVLGVVLFLYKGHWDINSLEGKPILSVVIVLGCFTKSAQFPFSSWLPAAMAAPTPVSSLVHSSTLVTAGIYLLIRFCHMFPGWLFVLIGIRGMWTLYLASLAACCEYDGKKVVAYSTLSQLGLMAVAVSLGLPIFAFFHLVTHALFKALLFICIGYFIVNSGHFQDLRRLKGLWKNNPLLSVTFLVRSLSLMGFPFLAGFFSKELILENKIVVYRGLFHLLLLFSLPLTSYYSSRLFFKVMKGTSFSRVGGAKDEKVLFFSLFPLYLGRIFFGFIFYPWFYSFRSIFPSTFLKIFVLFLISLGVFLSWVNIKAKKKFFIWFCGTIGFLVPFKSSF